MANRYLRATGNWNGAVWADTSDGTAGSAATPTASDVVYISANFTVTLSADATCGALWHTNGQLSLSSYKLTITCEEMMTGDGGFESTGTTTRTLDLGSGHLELANMDNYVGARFNLSGSNLNFIAGTSLITMNVWGGSFAPYSGTFYTADKAFNDVRINFYNSSGTPASAQLNIAGSPTFRLLDIRSTNSAAHTVNIGSNTITTQKFIGVGSSTSNRLTITNGGDPDFAGMIGNTYDGTSSCYGQNLNIVNVDYTDDEATGHPLGYVGSSSTTGGSLGTYGWLLQDPPKISTLVDPLTTAPGSNSNWTVHPAAEYFGSLFSLTPVVAALHEGAYVIGATPDETSFGGMMSTDTYDFTNSTFIMEVLGADGAASGRITIVLDASESSELQKLEWENDFAPVSGVPDDIIAYSLRGVTYSVSNTLTHTSGPRWVKIRMDDDTLYTSISFDGSTFTTEKSLALPDDAIYLLKSTRVSLVNFYTAAIGSINPTLASPSNANFLAFFYP